MTITRKPIFNPSTKNRSPISFMRDDPKAPFDHNQIVSDEFKHAILEMLLFKENDKIMKQLYKMREGSFCTLNLLDEFNFNCAVSRMRLLDSFRINPAHWPFQDALILKAFIAFCEYVEESDGIFFHLTDLKRQDFMTFMSWFNSNRPPHPLFQKFLTWEELKQAIEVL